MIKKYDCENCKNYCEEDKSCTVCPPYKRMNLNCGGREYESYRETHEIVIDEETFEGLKTGGNDVYRLIIDCPGVPDDALVYQVRLTDEDASKILKV